MSFNRTAVSARVHVRAGFRRLTPALACVLVFLSRGFAQTATQGVSNSSAAGQTQSQPKLPSVNTTVVVHGETKDDYLPETVTVGTLDGATLQQTPLSATVVTRDLLNDQVARVLSDVVKNDASIGEDYAPVGYYGDFEIRGFPIDLATGLQINGMTIAGEQDVPLENKQSVEFLKGIAGVESGVASAGGLINYVTKRPAAISVIETCKGIQPSEQFCSGRDEEDQRKELIVNTPHYTRAADRRGVAAQGVVRQT